MTIIYDVTKNPGGGYMDTEDVQVVGRFVFDDNERVVERHGEYAKGWDDITTLEQFFTRVIGTRGTRGARLVETEAPEPAPEPADADVARSRAIAHVRDL